jgi:Tol biopolymer transport system component
MQRITWYGLLAVVALIAPIGGQAQAPQAPMPRANVRELATIEADVTKIDLLPSGRALIYTVLSDRNTNRGRPRAEDSTFAYDIATKRSTLLGTNMLGQKVSPQGDRFAFIRSSEDGRSFLWTMPIDPETGIATGQAQRVGLQPGAGGAFSPDGRMLLLHAFRQDGAQDLVVTPATGGVERIVANYPRGFRSGGWSPDGKSLYVVRESDDPRTAVERVSVVGGRSEPVVPRTPITGNTVVGLSPDGRVAFFRANPDRYFYRTISGVEGEISVALPPLDTGWSYNPRIESRLQYATFTQVRHQGVRILDLATGQARDLLPGVHTSAPAWSPDGRRIAVLSGPLSHRDIIVMNADGSGQRRYPLSPHLEDWGSSPLESPMPWSPDGRFLAFRATDQQKVAQGPNDQRQLVLLDVNSGQTRVLTTSSARIDRFVWRSDGGAIRTLTRSVVPIGPSSRWTIAEIPLNGAERSLRDLSAEFPKANYVVFASDRTAVVKVATDRSPEWFLVPLDGGAAQRLPDPGFEPGSQVGGALVSGNRLGIGSINPRGETVAKVLSTVGDSTWTVRLPFEGVYAVPLPDGKQFVNSGKATGDSVWKLFLVSLDGSASRPVGEIPRGTGGLLAVSPDGKLVAYTSDGPVTTKILEIDFEPVLQAIVKR